MVKLWGPYFFLFMFFISVRCYLGSRLSGALQREQVSALDLQSTATKHRITQEYVHIVPDVFRQDPQQKQKSLKAA